MESNIGLLLLIGLPGCGKTSLCKKLLLNKDSQYSKLNFIHVSFDDHIPLDNQEKFAIMKQKEDNVDNEDTWKNARYKLYLSVEEMIKGLKAETVNDAFKKFTNIEKVYSDNQFIVLLDDNFYYKSMRYEYYQMARSLSIGYCQVYIECSISDAIKNNSKRETQIPNSVIQVMSERMQIPQKHNLEWEKNSIELLSNNVDVSIKFVYDLAVKCLRNPVCPLEDREEEIAISKLQCSQSVAHQADIILRSLVGTIIKDAKNTNKISPNEFSKFSKNVNACRQKVLTSLQDGTILLPHYLASNVNINNKEELRYFLQQELENLL